MEKKRYVFMWTGICLSLLLSVATIILCIIKFNSNTFTANEIYTQCLNNVVEVKAESDDVGESFGTGVILTSDGTLVTNAHVVTYTRLGVADEFDNYYIRFSFENDYRAVSLEKYDADLDLAVLKLSDDVNLKPITTGDSDFLKAGDKVYAVGNAANYGIGIFEGIISIPLLNIELEEVTRSVIQCDLTIAQGNSGGALLSEKGELIGITTFRTKDNSGNVIYGIVYCIPVNTVTEYVFG